MLSVIILSSEMMLLKLFISGGDDKLLNRQQIYEQLSAIVVRSSYPFSTSLGFMTSEHRSVWGALYERLLKNQVEVRNLKTFQMRRRISIRACVRPSVHPSVRPSVTRL